MIGGDEMWLYLLENKVGGTRQDTLRSIVVRAENSTRARYLAADKAGDEGCRTWQDPNMSTCEKIGSGPGDEAVICIDFHEG